MSVIENLDSVVMLCDVASAMLPTDRAEVAIKRAETAAADFVVANRDAIRQAMIDARRYRWLREHSHLQDGLEFWIDPVIAIDYKPGAQLNGMHETLDAAIDARLASDGEGEE